MYKKGKGQLLCKFKFLEKIQQHTYAVNSISPKFPHIYIYTKFRIQTIQVKHTIY